MDFYERTGEHVAVHLGAMWEVAGSALAAALDGLDPASGPVVDVGAGTEWGTGLIARALAGVEIVARSRIGRCARHCSPGSSHTQTCGPA